MNEVAAIWIAYILTRPLGASTGDLLSQPRADGGLGLGTTATSALFLLAILAVVVYLTLTKEEVEEVREAKQLTIVEMDPVIAPSAEVEMNDRT